mmetsp:Transcript_14625/g.24276  ORF Transcript_14625/g.24276 Transcript_14625/m.24276 type:complete len:86 (+) Transcript_14625:970-1227(+)
MHSTSTASFLRVPWPEGGGVGSVCVGKREAAAPGLGAGRIEHKERREDTESSMGGCSGRYRVARWELSCSRACLAQRLMAEYLKG